MPKKFKRNFLQMLELRGLTISEVSRLSGMERPCIYSILKPQRKNICISSIKKLASALGCTPGWLTR